MLLPFSFRLPLFVCFQLEDEDTATSCFCKICGKHFSTTNAYDNHLHSKKHRLAAVAHDTDAETLPLEVQEKNAKNAELNVSAGIVSHHAKNRQLKHSSPTGQSEQEASCSLAAALSQTPGTSGEELKFIVCFWCVLRLLLYIVGYFFSHLGLSAKSIVCLFSLRRHLKENKY